MYIYHANLTVTYEILYILHANFTVTYEFVYWYLGGQLLQID